MVHSFGLDGVNINNLRISYFIEYIKFLYEHIHSDKNALIVLAPR
jgi:hypothetical protein